MTQPAPDSGAIRIGKSERDEAIKALDEHLSEGRIDAEEYGERSARVYTARTWGDITPLFTDLPEPRPAPPTAPRRSPSTLVPASMPGREVASGQPGSRRVSSVVFALTPFIAVVLFVLTREWLFFLLIPVAAVVAGAVHGSSRN